MTPKQRIQKRRNYLNRGRGRHPNMPWHVFTMKVENMNHAERLDHLDTAPRRQYATARREARWQERFQRWCSRPAPSPTKLGYTLNGRPGPRTDSPLYTGE